MSSEAMGSILGAIVAVIVLAVAIVFGPIGQYGKPAKTEQPAATAPSEPAPRGPVIREVPNQ